KLINFEIDDNESSCRFFKHKKVPKAPCKVLDAPSLKDDFYLHLIDWSSKDFLAVGLDKSLYMWEGKSSNVSCLTTYEDDQHLTSVCWLNDGNTLLYGTSHGKIILWDVEKNKSVLSFNSHIERVGVISKMNCNNNL